MDVPDTIQLMGEKQWEEIKSRLTGKFNKMMKGLFRQKGAQLDINILAGDEAQEFITTHAGVLDAGFQKVEMSDKMRERLTRSNYIFSGIKTSTSSTRLSLPCSMRMAIKSRSNAF